MGQPTSDRQKARSAGVCRSGHWRLRPSDWPFAGFWKIHEMNPDRVGEHHFKLYGKSDKANARGNQNAEFQAGYAWGVRSFAYDCEKIIEEEHALRKKVNGDRQNGFAEWKRGFWAARSQMVAAGIRKRRIRGGLLE